MFFFNVVAEISKGHYDRKPERVNLVVPSIEGTDSRSLRESIRSFAQSKYRRMVRILSIEKQESIENDPLFPSEGTGTQFHEKWYNGRMVAFDVETTGFSPDSESIIEIGFAEFSKEDKKFAPLKSFFANPGKKLPSKITEITGIRDEDLVDALYFSEISIEVVDIINGADILIAHNKGFDISFLLSELGRCDALDCLHMPPVFCSLELGLVTDVGQSNNKLASIQEALGIEGQNSHRAMDDACLAGNAFLALSKRNPAFLSMSTEEAISFFDNIKGK
jgi:DNA polymerase III epsilon subunit family exonuclease